VRDFGVEAQQAAEAHLAACDDALEAEQDPDAEFEWPMLAGPYCGCPTCVVREVLHAAWPIFEQSRE
jgi:hypothetical protein